MADIQIVIPVWGFGKAGGDRVLAQLANHFHKAGIKTLMVSPYYSNSPYYPVECPIQYVDKKGDVVPHKNIDDHRNLIKKSTSMLERYHGLINALNRLSAEYNVVIANYSLTAYAVDKCKINNKFYYIQAYEVFDTEGQKNPLTIIKNSLIKRSYNLNLVRIVNADIYKNYKEIKSDYVVHPGLDLSVYYRKQSKINTENGIVVGCIGRIAKWKGSNDAAKAVEILQKKGIPVKFLVAFNPVDYSVFKLVKPDGDKNLADYYRSLDVLIAPGTVQLGAIHYPVIEAMACGTSVITTGYFPANESNSYIVPVSSPVDIARVIEDIYKNPDEANKKTDIAYGLMGEFSWNKVSEKMLSIIRQNMEEI